MHKASEYIHYCDQGLGGGMRATECPQNPTQGRYSLVVIHSKFLRNPFITFRVLLITDKHALTELRKHNLLQIHWQGVPH